MQKSSSSDIPMIPHADAWLKHDYVVFHQAADNLGENVPNNDAYAALPAIIYTPGVKLSRGKHY